VFAIFEDIGMSEILVIGIVGVLLFGKRLPEVASQAGQQLVKFRRSLQQVKAESGMDQEVRKIQRTIEEAIPRDFSVGEVARLASARVQERIQSARKEIDLEIGKPLPEVSPAPPDPAAPPQATPPQPQPPHAPPATD
jgi:Sec-independent protein translocase protein TatA